jgi:hypothetical protein
LIYSFSFIVVKTNIVCLLKIYAKLSEVDYCKTYKKFYAGISYSRVLVESEGLLSEKDVVDFPCEEIATRLSGSLLLKCGHSKRPCSLTLRDAFLDNSPSDFTDEINKENGGCQNG